MKYGISFFKEVYLEYSALKLEKTNDAVHYYNLNNRYNFLSELMKYISESRSSYSLEDWIELNTFLIKVNNNDLFLLSLYYVDNFSDLLLYTNEFNDKINLSYHNDKKSYFFEKLFSRVTYIYANIIINYNDISSKEYIQLNPYNIKHKDFYDLVENYIEESLYLKNFNYRLIDSFFIDMFVDNIINICIHSINNGQVNRYYYSQVLNNLYRNRHLDDKDCNKIIYGIGFLSRNFLCFASGEEENLFKREVLDFISNGSPIESFIYDNNSEWKKGIIHDLKLELKNSNKIIKDLLDD